MVQTHSFVSMARESIAVRMNWSEVCSFLFVSLRKAFVSLQIKYDQFGNFTVMTNMYGRFSRYII